MLTTIALLSAQIIYGRSHDANEKKYQITKNLILSKESLKIENSQKQREINKFQHPQNHV